MVTPHRERTGRHAFVVAAGILISRIVGLVRQRIFGHYFGLSDAADAFAAAFRVPNLLQNLFGEGILSASFIPVYARLLAEGDEEESRRVAGAVGAVLALAASALVLAGVLTAPYLIWIIAPGFHGEKRDLTIQLVRILFPGAGLLVFSAWCLGILNSHRRFFISYTAPVVWNAAMIATLIIFGGTHPNVLAIDLAWGSVIGSALQFGVQLPVVLRLTRNLRIRLGTRDGHVREVLRNFTPVFVSRGVVQLSGYVDQVIASMVGAGAVTALSYSQSINTLPVSLFAMAISAAELPAMSSAIGDPAQVAAQLHTRLNSGLRRIAFFVVPSAVAFLALGDVITSALYQTGKFTHDDSIYVWAILAGSAVGLVASALGRLYSSTYYALRDTSTPLRYAVARVLLTTALGYLCAIPLPRWLGIDARWGMAGLTASTGVAGWVEFALLRRTLNQRIGRTGLPLWLAARLWISATLAASAAWAVKLMLGHPGSILSAAAILGTYGVIYFAASYLLRIEECRLTVKRFIR
ncbi:MAG TPA: murein biosynthesis integral membrane protein MurJ [Verrucomicrobiae bacterium]|jgi:putative peptidoglycan lipid II flippase|nr:murein biosynthesis integral membrane protein MurJ [Verrucomicrobiae bacterium]